MTGGGQGLIRRWRLVPHPEGGYYREVWRAAGRIRHTALPRGYRGPRPYVTSILFMLPAGTVSRWHRVRSDELWCWQGGGSIDLVVIESRGRIRRVRIGPRRGEHLQFAVRGGRWFAARPARGSRWGLAGCIVAPGFDFRDFELADPAGLRRRYPRSASLISAFAGAPPRGRAGADRR